jgi:hypothetical protein
MSQEYQNNYQPSYAAPGYSGTYAPTYKAPWPLRIVFWFFYLTGGWSISFTFALTYVLLAVLLPFSLPYALFIRFAPLPPEIMNNVDWLLRYNEGLFFMTYSFATIIGVVMLLNLGRVGRAFANVHKWLFRYLGGLDIR